MKGCVLGCIPADHERLGHERFKASVAGLELTPHEHGLLLDGWERAWDQLAPALRRVKHRLYTLRDDDHNWEDAAQGAWEIANEALRSKAG
jgi:hypothetical protein